MMNKKLIALLITVETVSGAFAGWYDDNGVYHHGMRPGHIAGDTARGAGHVTEEAVEGTGAVVGGTIGGIFGGKGVSERMEENEARRADREARRRERYNRE